MNTPQTQAPQPQAPQPLPLLPEQVEHLPNGWRNASPQQMLVLQRIAAQRVRLKAARQARVQAKALKAERRVPVDAPFAERAKVFAQLHPVVTAAAAGALLLVGPRRLWRLARIVAPALPVLMKLRK